jgi:ABC-2 type transport system permease protein
VTSVDAISGKHNVQSCRTASATTLRFLGSGFVPTHSMPIGLRLFASYQPFTPVTETLRGLLLGTPIGTDAVVAAAWCAGIALLAYL